jgi:hypothetical protein
MQRANCHAMDPCYPSMLSNLGVIQQLDGDVCLEIRGGMSASMKKDAYDMRICISCGGLVTCFALR